MITAIEAMARAIDCAERGSDSTGMLWVAIARELREGSRPARDALGTIVTPRPLRDADEPAVRSAEHVMQDELDASGDENDAETLYGYRRGQARPPSLTAYRSAIKLRKALDRGEELALHGALHIDRDKLDSLVFEILQRAPMAWRDLPADDERPQRYVFGIDGSGPAAVAAFGDRLGTVAGWIETDEQRAQRFAAGAGGTRPYLRDEETRVLDAGDPSSCRHCGGSIYEVAARDVGTSHRYRHTLTEQAVCPSPPRHTDEHGDESYVSGPHTFAEPGGLPYGRR